MTTESPSLDELLSRETYEGMSDEEIQRVVDFNVDIAAKQAANDADQKRNDDALIELRSIAAAHASDMLTLYEEARSLAASRSFGSASPIESMPQEVKDLVKEA